MEKTITIKIQKNTADRLKELSKRIGMTQYEIIDILLNDDNINEVLKSGFERKLDKLKNE